jgi:hypothetical protein
MQECCTCGSVRGALGNQRPYRDNFTGYPTTRTYGQTQSDICVHEGFKSRESLLQRLLSLDSLRQIRSILRIERSLLPRRLYSPPAFQFEDGHGSPRGMLDFIGQ